MDTEVAVMGTGVALKLDDLRAQIAAELASGLSDAEGVKERYWITEEQWEILRENPAFRGMVAEAIQTWAGDMNAGQRITKKAEILLEDSLPVLDQIAHNATFAPSVRIEAIKQIESITGRKNKDSVAGPSGGGFVLQINIGQEKKGVTLSGTSMPVLENE